MRFSIHPGYLGLCMVCNEDMFDGDDIVTVETSLDIPADSKVNEMLEAAGLPILPDIESVKHYEHLACNQSKVAVLARD